MNPTQSYSAHRPYAEPPARLSDLSGQRTGMVNLPITIDWGPQRSYDLGDEADRRILYERVLREAASTAEICRWVDGPRLVEAWPSMWLPARLKALWEQRFPQLQRRAA